MYIQTYDAYKRVEKCSLRWYSHYTEHHSPQGNDTTSLKSPGGTFKCDSYLIGSGRDCRSLKWETEAPLLTYQTAVSRRPPRIKGGHFRLRARSAWNCEAAPPVNPSWTHLRSPWTHPRSGWVVVKAASEWVSEEGAGSRFLFFLHTKRSRKWSPLPPIPIPARPPRRRHEHRPAAHRRSSQPPHLPHPASQEPKGLQWQVSGSRE